jgi:2-polyprenyl-3-methyl-5-hydroxy-6-metoxy-1,4-benzoquinol methylase
MPLLSEFAQKRKIKYFIENIPKYKSVLEIGSGSGWVGNYLKVNGWTNYTGIDIVPPADIVGDIKQWKTLGLKEESFDIIIAFEVVEHIDCFIECLTLLKSGGMLLLTTPVPHMDWFLIIMEFLGLNQKRTSPHNNLVYLKNVSCFTNKKVKIIAFLTQWGIFTKENK